MSWSDSAAAMGAITGLVRLPSLKNLSCWLRYRSLCPARFGQSGVVLLPLGPWQAEQTAALVAPSAAPSAGAEAAMLMPARAATNLHNFIPGAPLAVLELVPPVAGVPTGGELYTKLN